MQNIHFTGTNAGLAARWTAGGDKPFLCLTANRRLAETLFVNLETLHGETVGLLPDWDQLPGTGELPEENLQEQRLKTLIKLKNNQLNGLVLPLQALGMPVLKPDILPVLKLRPGDTYPPRQLTRKLLSLGFQRQPLAQERGDFARRGDLLDLFPENSRYPIRLSFFDEEIEAIEYYHPNTQMQAEETPATPLILTLQSEFALAPDRREELAETLTAHGCEHQAEILEYSPRPRQAADWFGYWPRATVWPEKLFADYETIVYQPGKCEATAEKWEENLQTLESKSPAAATYRSLQQTLKTLTASNTVFFSKLPQKSESTADTPVKNYGTALELTPAPSLDPRPIEDFIEKISALTGEVAKIIIHCGEKSFTERLTTLLQEELGAATEINGTKIQLEATSWRGSYRLENEARLSLDDFFDRTIQRGRLGTASGKTEYLESFEELNEQDLVVHEDFGIGRFEGLKLISTENQTRDCIHLEYAGGDRLYLPPDQMARVQKYIADSGFTPALSSLTSNRWARVKSNVKEEVDELAEELLELYAHREEGETEPYPPDSLEQTQFEASFPYRETPDQQESIEAVKRDMQESKPMDRLICGDSGYGKTEVALRAAFKAVNDGRQVAMLVPTTVLTRQHYETFAHRFSIFPYRVEMLNRFQTDRETKRILRELETGDVDIVIGTHKLIKTELEFDELGLLIIDEEQRFGVKQKEKLKLERKNVDVLTLSATPIPRTLYMSLSGIQDISVINTPPEERIPIKIHTGPFDPELAQQAAEHELDRGGQVFWIYNRVKKIKQVTEYVRSLLPEATVEYAHGRLSKQVLKETMDRFYGGEIDVLVSTTIIEAGLDCPRVNTMVVQQAQKFGLAQLYQLRGRIGRSHEQAHAYLFYPEGVQLTEDAETRLKTIKECSEMGSGFKLAMRDLEIRGAGNLLGKNQHGNIRAVGFPFYCRLLQRSIRRLREGFEVPKPYPRLKFPGEYFIPRDYIPDEKQIISQYQALASCRTPAEVNNLARQWKETFGPLPEPVRQALHRHLFKILANQEEWEDIHYKNRRLNLKYSGDKPKTLAEVAESVGAHPFSRGDRFFIRSFSPEQLQEWLKILIEDKLELLEPTGNEE